jgi:hypothetical protein
MEVGGGLQPQQTPSTDAAGRPPLSLDPGKIHLVDRARQIGCCYEELLDLGHAPGVWTR